MSAMYSMIGLIASNASATPPKQPFNPHPSCQQLQQTLLTVPSTPVSIPCKIRPAILKTEMNQVFGKENGILTSIQRIARRVPAFLRVR
jgi:hypothetical protein